MVAGAGTAGSGCRAHAHETLFVTECTAAKDNVCNHVGAQGYPTLEHGDPKALEDCQGGRDLGALQAHASGCRAL